MEVKLYAFQWSWVYYLREYDEKRSRAIVYSIIKYLNSVSDDQLVEVCTLSKKDAYILDKCLCLPPIITPEERMEIHEKSKNSVLFLIFRCLNTLLEIVPKQRKYIKRLEMFRLKMILRFLRLLSSRSLQIPVLKLNALNEIARVLKDVTKSSRSLACGKHDKYLTKDKMKKWIFYNKVVSMIVHSFYQLEMWLPQSEDMKISENQSYNAENKWESELQMLRRIQLLRKATSPNSEERQVIPILEYWLRKPDYHEMTAREITFVFIVCGRLLTFKRCICRFLKFKYTR
ncbi:putative ubiquitin carboxyl-terminal hydrolase FAF-X [Holothuria leucospilota]|uniref:Ubiquitin carboxyl-terminal hydrolase FAF-X n=1 Tax=Holothuria leucospilota TaxID=206669 RepID=A0A9Q1BQF2_HOLLE|nr:putative ubiquitin carboxyl-terminal hydrolase FAF-X [Holothuria leucospilota]